MAETTAPPKLSTWRRKEVWGPVAILLTQVVLVLLINPIGQQPSEVNWRISLLGGMISLPVFWAMWSAWSPYVPATRLPTGALASAMIGVVFCAVVGELMGFLGITTLFALFLGVFVVWRKRSGTRLSADERAAMPTAVHAARQFGLGQLLLWTAGTALVASLLKATVTRFAGPVGAVDFVIEMAKVLALFGLNMGTVFAVAAWLLAPWRVRPVAVLAYVASFVPITAGSAAFMLFTSHIPNTWAEYLKAWATIAWIDLGAATMLGASALALRWCGYRLVRGEAKPDA
ncbi:hypothetical protein Mal64_29330 [Pseudobythopirellula maris]|uniref:Uncharacterized protein n=1 Tax=Pseudobythopirellula maris TaxID=2527991 RepID=A0A5C5ZJ50_9BACT|nr:hypothetical protein [Pseudobythopirellula maris]TWT87394.1 hypothetical protein Mal64_29330 [Pseudobythopirellula maris]